VDLEARLRTIADTLPEGAAIILSATALRGLLRPDEDHNTGNPHDMTVQEVAEHLHRSPQTIRRMIHAGGLDAYTFRNRGYRITPASLAEFTEHGRDGGDDPPVPTLESVQVNLGSWRKVRPKGDGHGQIGPVK
jgi:excisionase family DNA binding protein